MGNNWNNKLFVAEGIIARFASMSNACVDQHLTAILMVLTPRKPVFAITFFRAMPIPGS